MHDGERHTPQQQSHSTNGGPKAYDTTIGDDSVFGQPRLTTPDTSTTSATDQSTNIGRVPTFLVDCHTFNVGQSFHTVRGRRRYGLLMDTGASTGLIGTDTLLEYMNNVKVPPGQKLDTSASTTVTGISGTGISALGNHRLPLNLPFECAHEGFLIGGEGGRCPILCCLSAVIQNKVDLLQGVYENGNGIAIVSGGPTVFCLRMLYTDSKHYLLPTDEVPTSEEQYECTTRAANHLQGVRQRLVQRMQKQLKDLAGQNESQSQRRPSKSQPKQRLNTTLTTLHEQKTMPTSDNGPLHYGTHTTVPTLTHPPGLDYTCTDDDRKHNAHDDVTNGVDPTTDTPPQQHSHYQARTRENTQRNRRDDQRQTRQMTKRRPVVSWDGPIYKHDVFADDYSPDELKQHALRYQYIPEEYYTRSHREHVSLAEVELYLQMHPEPQERWDYQEIASGSGRLSWMAEQGGLNVGFPVDRRYGWEMSKASRQLLLMKVWRRFRPRIISGAPDCRFWGRLAGRNYTPEELQRLRANEEPFLEFLQKACVHQDNNGDAYLIESTGKSIIFRDCTLSLLHTLDRNRERLTDGCCFGASNSKGELVQKGYELNSNFILRQSTWRCNHQRHGELAGTDIRSSAVYPKRFCQALVTDFMKYVNKHNTYHTDTTSDATFHTDNDNKPSQQLVTSLTATPTTNNDNKHNQ